MSSGGGRCDCPADWARMRLGALTGRELPFTGSEGSESETSSVGAERPKRVLNVTLILKNGNSGLRKEMSLRKDRIGPGENQAWPRKLEASHASGFQIFEAIKGPWDVLT